MDDAEQARAYAAADFVAPHTQFVEQFVRLYPDSEPHHVLDLGCGPGDISVRFARQFPSALLHGIDGSAAMLAEGQALLEKTEPAVRTRIRLCQGFIPRDPPPLPSYDTILSNSLLHHLHDPRVLWRYIQHHARPGTLVLLMDLRRPMDMATARRITEEYYADEADILCRDFYRSLLAAFTGAEIVAQLVAVDMDYLNVEEVGDRHLLIHGVVQGQVRHV